MPAAKKSEGSSTASPAITVTGLIAWFFGGGRVVTFALAAAAGLYGLWYTAWHTLGVSQHVLASPEYIVGPHDLEITPLPRWIHTDVEGEVYREASVDGPLSIMDDQLVTRLRDAFALHPWVRKVERVSKYHPAHVKVELEYRQPVCMVEVPGGLYAVDVEGAWLPWPDFTPVEASQYARLTAIDTMPVGSVGTRWGDARVVGGAETAAALMPVWAQLQLERIVPSTGCSPTSEVCTFDLFTRGKTRILWGHAPGSAVAGETPAEEKVARLKRFADEHGTLDGTRGPQELDVRGPGPLAIVPLTARKPGNKTR